MEKAVFKKGRSLLREGRRVDIYRFILAEKANFEVTAMCEVLAVSPSAFYEWVGEQEAEHTRRDAALRSRIQQLFVHFHGRYGAPRIQAELAKEGERVSRKRVARLMRESGLRAKSARKYKATTDSNHTLPIAPNLLERRFDVAAPNAVWVSDITYLWTRQGWMYLAVIIDLYSRKVVSWSLRERMTAALVCEALDAAVRARRPPKGLVFHSDRGSQYASKAFRRRLFRYRMQQSMSRKGNCWDNAVAESFFATFKKELVRNHVFTTRETARREVFEYIEIFYNRHRAHSLLRYETPTAFEACDLKSESA